VTSAGSNRQFSKLEFDRLVRHIQYARDEPDKQREGLKE